MNRKKSPADKRVTKSVVLSGSEIEALIANHPSLSEGIRAMLTKQTELINELKELRK